MREVAFDPADAVPTGREAGAAQFVEPVQQDFPIPERVKEHGHGTDIQRLCAEPELMADDALDLPHDGAKIFGTLRYGDVHQFLDRPAIGKVVVHGADIIQAVRVRDELMIGPVLGQFFHPPVQEAHDGDRLDDPLPFQLEDDLQHPMRAGVLRAHVQE